MVYRDPVDFAVPGNRLVVGDTVGFRGLASRPAFRIGVRACDRNDPFLPFLGPPAADTPPRVA